jgi:hypothetical protein
MSYLGNLPNTNINGVSPTASAAQAFGFVQAVNGLQSADMNHAALIVESDLASE